MDPKGRRAYFLHHHWGIVVNGKLQRIWASSRDITELRILEAQVRHAQKLDTIGRLAGGVAHDFNNLLTVIRGYSSQLLERANSTDDTYIGLTEIHKAAEKGAALTNQLLAFSRKQSAQMQLLNLNPMVAEDERMLRRLIGEKIELIIKLEPSLGLVCADVGSMHQVLLNLALNARDAMPNGGKLIIELSNVDVGETRPARLAPLGLGPYVRFSVSDTGVGMSADVQEHLFEPFFTTKEVNQGTGLGLSTVYGIVRQSGGHIVVETEPNKGATFEIFLPRVTPQPGTGRA
jgi:signal transduction histidine kinase